MKSYTEFLNENNIGFIDYIQTNGKRELISSLSVCEFLSIEERQFSIMLLEENLIEFLFIDKLDEESIADKIKAKATAAIQVAKERGKEYLSTAQETILKLGGNIKAFTGKILNAIKEFLAKAWNYIKDKVDSSYSAIKDDVTKAATVKFKGKSDIAKKEIKNLSDMAKSTAKWATGGVLSSIGTGIEKAGQIDEAYLEVIENSLYLAIAELINEDKEFFNYILSNNINESEGGIHIPFISSLAKKMSNLEPFKTLHNVEHIAGDAANKGLSKISDILSKIANAPGPFEFTIIGSVFALITGYAIKSGVTSIIKEIGATGAGAAIVSLIPGLGIILLSMKYAAKGIWCVGVCEAALTIVTGDKRGTNNH